MMTAILKEPEWLADDTSPRAMLDRVFWGDLISERKLRLFALAVSRWLGPGWDHRHICRIEEAWENAESMAENGDRRTTGEGFWVENHSSWKAAKAAIRELTLGQMMYGAAFLREMVGNPFHQPRAEVLFRDTSKLTNLLQWRDNTIQRMAVMIYQERSFDKLPILGDALEEAGCDDIDILAHCRGQERCPECLGAGRKQVVFEDGATWVSECSRCGSKGTIPLRVQHCLGCWVLDLLTGRR